jgi:transposase-like protein
VRAPLLVVIDGNPGLCQALGRTWPATAVQRRAVHKLRNLEREAPKHALDELRQDFHRIVYAASADAGRAASSAFERGRRLEQWLQRPADPALVAPR